MTHHKKYKDWKNLMGYEIPNTEINNRPVSNFRKDKIGSLSFHKQGDIFYQIQLSEQLEEMFERNHPRIYRFLSKLERANPNCAYLNMQREI